VLLSQAAAPLTYSYHSNLASGGTQSSQLAQVIQVPQYTNVTVTAPGSIVANAWNYATGTGGVLAETKPFLDEYLGTP
jgi:hypothetical protein